MHQIKLFPFGILTSTFLIMADIYTKGVDSLLIQALQLVRTANTESCEGWSYYRVQQYSKEIRQFKVEIEEPKAESKQVEDDETSVSMHLY